MENLDLIKPDRFSIQLIETNVFDDCTTERRREKAVVIGSNNNGLSEDAERLR